MTRHAFVFALVLFMPFQAFAQAPAMPSAAAASADKMKAAAAADATQAKTTAATDTSKAGAAAGSAATQAKGTAATGAAGAQAAATDVGKAGAQAADKTAAKAKGAGAKLLDLNTATVDEIKAIPGLTAVADKIVAARPFANKAQLVSKKILDKASYDQVKELVVAKKVSAVSAPKPAK